MEKNKDVERRHLIRNRAMSIILAFASEDEEMKSNRASLIKGDELNEEELIYLVQVLRDVAEFDAADYIVKYFGLRHVA